LPDALKKKIARLVQGSKRSAHAFMVEAIQEAADREELRRRFGEEAEQSEREAEQSGLLFEADAVFKHLQARARGRRSARPKPTRWQRSKRQDSR
jgi:predicted transcriptional regulator